MNTKCRILSLRSGPNRHGFAPFRAPFQWLLAAGVCVALALALPLELRARALGQRYAVASESEAAARAALDRLKAGGNAVDAAVTAALVAGVASPTSSGLGGGGFAMVFAANGAPWVLDFRETAPAGVDPAAFERRPLPEDERGRLIGVPGELKGLFELHRRAGSLRWRDVVAPAADLARRGFRVRAHLGAMLKFAAPKLGDAPLQSLFFLRGQPVGVGAVVKNAPLAKTLERVAAEGPAALYEGPIAAELVDTARSVGGALSLADLRGYKPIERSPLHVAYAGNEVYTMPPPSAGGMMLVQTLKLFGAERLRKLGLESGAYQHLVAEGLRAAIADRMRYLGDPAYESFDFGALISDARMNVRRGRIALDRTHAIPRFGLEEHGTHHLVTADARGMVVSLTTTVNRIFGARVVGEKSGIVLNDELDDFTARADVAPFGMSQSPNRPRPGARPVSSMTPTIVLRDGRAVLALGGSGGPTIATNVTQLVLANLVFGVPPERAVSARRFYVPTSGAYMLLEKGAPPALVADLERRGEIVGTMPFNGSAVQMIARDGNAWRAAADPRKHGTALVE